MNKVNKYFLKCSTPQQIGFFHIPLTFYTYGMKIYMIRDTKEYFV